MGKLGIPLRQKKDKLNILDSHYPAVASYYFNNSMYIVLPNAILYILLYNIVFFPTCYIMTVTPLDFFSKYIIKCSIIYLIIHYLWDVSNLGCLGHFQFVVIKSNIIRILWVPIIISLV